MSTRPNDSVGEPTLESNPRKMTQKLGGFRSKYLHSCLRCKEGAPSALELPSCFLRFVETILQNVPRRHGVTVGESPRLQVLAMPSCD